MPTELLDLEVDEVSLVDEPANKGARVLFWKRAAVMPDEPVTKADDIMQAALLQAFEKAGVEGDALDEIKAVLTGAASEVERLMVASQEELTVASEGGDAAVKELEVTKAANAELIQKVADLTAKLEAQTTEVAKAADLTKRLEVAESSLAVMAKDARVSKLAAELQAEGVEGAADLAKHLDGMAAETATYFKDRAITEAKLAKANSALLVPAGVSTVTKADSAEAEIFAKAKKLVEGGVHKTLELATVAVLEGDVALRKRHNAELGRQA